MIEANKKIKYINLSKNSQNILSITKYLKKGEFQYKIENDDTIWRRKWTRQENWEQVKLRKAR